MAQNETYFSMLEAAQSAALNNALAYSISGLATSGSYGCASMNQQATQSQESERKSKLLLLCN